MFSMEYFKYLIKSKKYLILIVFLLTLFAAFIEYKESSIAAQSFFSGVLLYIMPVLVFYYVHDKKAVDTFFSIPVSRKRMLLTSLLFIVLVIFIPQLIGTIIFGIRAQYLISDILITSIKSLLGICAVTAFNSALFLLANNIIDGIIVIGAYTCLPIYIIIVLEEFFRTFVAGMIDFDFSSVGYLSPIFMSMDIVNQYINGMYYLRYHTIVLFIVLVVFFIVLYRNYVFRKVERANTLSTNYATYPAIMAIYLFMVLFMLSTGLGNLRSGTAGLLGFLKENIIMYIILFAIFVSAYFIYKRQLKFSIKLPILFIVASIITILFAQYAKTSRGFGLADQYIKNEPRTYYSINAWSNDTGSELDRMVVEKLGYRSDYVNLNLMVGDAEIRASISDNCLDFMEKTRVKAIDDFYAYDYQIANTSGNMYIKTKKGNSYEIYTYRLMDVNYEDLLSLSKEMYVDIYLQTDRGEYWLNPNGEFIASYLYNE